MPPHPPTEAATQLLLPLTAWLLEPPPHPKSCLRHWHPCHSYVPVPTVLVISLPDSYLHTNKQIINLLYNDVNNLSSISICYVGPKCVASNNDAKPLSLYDIHFSLIFIPRPDTHLGLNKQLINLRYNDVKNLTSILHCSKSMSSWKVRKALCMQDNRL